MKRQHPIKILTLTIKNFWLLLIPLVRGLINLQFDWWHWLKGAYIDVLTLLAILLLAFVRWRYMTYEIRENSIFFKGGIIAKYQYEIPFSVISSVTFQFSFFKRPIKATDIFIETDSTFGGVKEKSADLKMILSEKETQYLIQKLTDTQVGTKLFYYPSKWNLLIFSFLFSSATSGAAYIATLFIQGGRLFGQSVEQEVFRVVNDVSSKVAIAAPPAAIGVGLLVITGWLFSFISNILRHIGFRIFRQGYRVTIENGFFSRFLYSINIGKINYADFSQSVLMRLFHVRSIQVSCSGYGKRKQEIPVFVPITTDKEADASLRMLLPGFTVSDNIVEPGLKAVFVYLSGGILMVLASLMINLLGLIFFAEFHELLQFTSVMVLIPVAWLLIAESVAFSFSGIGFAKGHLTLRYGKWFKLHTVTVPQSRIASIRVRRTIFQLANGTCDIIVRTASENGKSHRIRYLPYGETIEFLSEILCLDVLS